MNMKINIDNVNEIWHIKKDKQLIIRIVYNDGFCDTSIVLNSEKDIFMRQIIAEEDIKGVKKK